ncbi:FkbM family methyltransferase [Helicobacter sp. 23-1045]
MAIKSIKKLVKRAFRKIRIDSSKEVDFLENLIHSAFCKIGIGSGGGVESSGEEGVFVLLKQSKSPYCIFDVGANVGKYLDLIIKSLNNGNLSRGGQTESVLDSAQIHCFEPSIHTFKMLQDFYYKNYAQHKNITLNNFGLGAKNATATLHYNAKGSGLASLTKRILEHFNIDFKESEKVKIITLDEYCKERNISHIHLLKYGHRRTRTRYFAGRKRNVC